MDYKILCYVCFYDNIDFMFRFFVFIYFNVFIWFIGIIKYNRIEEKVLGRCFLLNRNYIVRVYLIGVIWILVFFERYVVIDLILILICS